MSKLHRYLCGPTVHLVTYEERTRELSERLGVVLGDVRTRIFDDMSGPFTRSLQEIIARAYTTGVADGFAQGVAAEAANAQEEAAEESTA